MNIIVLRLDVVFGLVYLIEIGGFSGKFLFSMFIEIFYDMYVFIKVIFLFFVFSIV